MTLRDKKGFTLIELVVVIAVLAILAGIAVPLYSGYVEKAHEAADLQLLDSMNTAFAAACAARGINPQSFRSEDVLVRGASGGRNAVGGITIFGDPTLSEAVNRDFQLLFGDNANTEFLTYGVEDISLEGGVFTHNGLSLSNRWNGSNYAGNAEKLLGSLDSISGAITNSTTLNEILKVLQKDPDADPALAAALGDFTEVVGGYVGKAEMGNVAILFIAQDSGKLDTNTAYRNVNSVFEALSRMSATEIPDQTVSLLSSWGENTTAMTKVSLACAVATGFYNSVYGNGSVNSFQGNSLSDALRYIQNAAKDPAFQNYLNNEGRADVAAYLAAMALLDQNASTFDVVTDTFVEKGSEWLTAAGISA